MCPDSRGVRWGAISRANSNTESQRADGCACCHKSARTDKHAAPHICPDALKCADNGYTCRH